MITLTKEQEDIINSLNTEDSIIKINAYAGSGKTATVTELIKEIRKADKDCNILYLVFNKNACEEAKTKFDKLNLNVECFTAHGFALKRLMLNNWRISQKTGVEHPVHVISNIFGDDYLSLRNGNPNYKYVSYQKVNDLFDVYGKVWDGMFTFRENILKGGYKHLLKTEPKQCDIDFFQEYYNFLLKQGKYTHNMYLKEYALYVSETIRRYKYVFLDEAQDLNKFMLNIIKKIEYEKLYVVGDTYQQIYHWNGAINALEQFECKTYPLSKSFRITNKECEIANTVLSSRYKKFKDNNVPVVNLDKGDEEYDKNLLTLLFRLNGTMFDYAVEYMLEGNIKVHFLDSYNGEATDKFEETFAVPLYMFKKLLQCNINMKDEYKQFNKLFKTKKTCKEVDTFIRLADKEGMDFRNFIYEHFNALPLNLMKYFQFYHRNEERIIDVLTALKESENIENPEKEYWLCTAHRSKGLEWDNVKIAEDRWSLGSDEEVNLVYVACTRAKKHLDYSAIADMIGIEWEEDEEENVGVNEENVGVNDLEDEWVELYDNDPYSIKLLDK